MGGAGVALPAGILSFKTILTFLAIKISLLQQGLIKCRDGSLSLAVGEVGEVYQRIRVGARKIKIV